MCAHIFDHMRFLKLFFIQCHLGLPIALPFLFFIDFYIYVLLSGIIKNPFSIYLSIGLMVINSVSFCFSEYVFIWPSSFKDTFVGYRILDCYFLLAL